MTVHLERGDVERFRTLVGELLGLHFDEDKLDGLSDVLRQRMEANGSTRLGAYESRLRSDGREELRALAALLTVGETYFFRYWDHFRAFTEVVLPQHASALDGRRRLRILSAGCASGEEAYSLAILVRDHRPCAKSWDTQIRGIDVNPKMIERAERACYSPWSLRETSPEVRARNFRAQGRQFELDPGVRELVTFEERNLVEEDARFWQQGAFDVVFCRNVLMYLRPEAMRAVVQRIWRSLSPGGYLFLGHAETLRGVSQDFHLRHTHETFYYQRREAGPTDAPDPAHAIPASKTAPAAGGALDLGDESWIAGIQRASERIAQLSTPRTGHAHAQPHAAPLEAPVDAVAVDLGPAEELLRQERFADAMAVLHALPRSARADPDAQLLRAALLTNSGQLREAEDACAQLLARDELNAGAHYLMALCREHAGDGVAAAAHDKAATYLDAAFAMPHLHLGLLARRAGDLGRARAELGRALGLLAREDSSRILLFGGGFTREALEALCRAELRVAGGGL